MDRVVSIERVGLSPLPSLIFFSFPRSLSLIGCVVAVLFSFFHSVWLPFRSTERTKKTSENGILCSINYTRKKSPKGIEEEEKDKNWFVLNLFYAILTTPQKMAFSAVSTAITKTALAKEATETPEKKSPIGEKNELPTAIIIRVKGIIIIIIY